MCLRDRRGIAEHIMSELPKPKKEDIVEFVRSFVRYIR